MDAGTQDVVVGYYWSREDGLVYNRAGIGWKDSLGVKVWNTGTRCK